MKAFLPSSHRQSGARASSTTLLLVKTKTAYPIGPPPRKRAHQPAQVLAPCKAAPPQVKENGDSPILFTYREETLTLPSPLWAQPSAPPYLPVFICSPLLCTPICLPSLVHTPMPTLSCAHPYVHTLLYTPHTHHPHPSVHNPATRTPMSTPLCAYRTVHTPLSTPHFARPTVHTSLFTPSPGARAS